MNPHWIALARQRLLSLRDDAAGWGYRTGASSSVESTALACLGLLATESEHHPSIESVRSASLWLARNQRPDGSLGVSGDSLTPGWPTPYAILLWRHLDSHDANRSRAVQWLIRQEGKTGDPASDDGVIGHDTTIVGWSWVAGTHSWIEPTALAVLALRREGLAHHPRVREGVRLIRDRAIATGGWNCGNNKVFGTDLRPQLAPTGLALLALAGRIDRSMMVERANAYLQTTLPGTRSPQSLCWGLLGLKVWGCQPEFVEDWLVESFERSLPRADLAMRLSYLLLASGERAPALLAPMSGEVSHAG